MVLGLVNDTGIKSPLFPEEMEAERRYKNAYNFQISCLSSIAALFTSLAVALTGIHYSLYFFENEDPKKSSKDTGKLEKTMEKPSEKQMYITRGKDTLYMIKDNEGELEIVPYEVRDSGLDEIKDSTSVYDSLRNIDSIETRLYEQKSE